MNENEKKEQVSQESYLGDIGPEEPRHFDAQEKKAKDKSNKQQGTNQKKVEDKKKK